MSILGRSVHSGDLHPDAAPHQRYWSDRGLIVTVDGPEGRFERAIAKPFARIGSHERAEVVLSHSQVGVRQLYLHATDAGVFSIDLAPAENSGGWSHGWLAPEQVLSVGPYRIWAQLSGGERSMASNPVDLMAAHAWVPRDPVLSISVEDRHVGNARLACPLTIVGRHLPSRIRLSSQTVSRCHCLLYAGSTALWVIDLLSRSGTWIDARSVEVATLLPGGSLKVGRVEFAFRSDLLKQEPKRPAAASSPAMDIQTAEITRSPQTEVSSIQKLAADLESKRNDFERAKAAWQEERLAMESQLADRFDELARRQAQLDSERHTRETLDAEHQKREADILARQESWNAEIECNLAELAQQTAQLEKDRKELASRQEEFSRERTAWEKERRQLEEGLAQRSQSLDAGQRELDGLRSQLEARLLAHERDVAEAENRREAANAELERQTALADELRVELEAQRGSLRQESDALRRQQEQWLSEQREKEEDLARQMEELASICDPPPDEGGETPEPTATGGVPEGELDDDLFERMADRLMMFRRSKTRWQRLKRAAMRPFQRSDEDADLEEQKARKREPDGRPRFASVRGRATAVCVESEGRF